MASLEGSTGMSEERQKTKRRYSCAGCGQVLVLYVNPSEPPVHACPKQANRSVEFEELK